MRVNINDSIRIFDGKTGEWLAKVLSINRENIVLRVVEKIKEMILSDDIWVIFAPIKQQRMNIVIQKINETAIRIKLVLSIKFRAGNLPRICDSYTPYSPLI